jgi:hypothetical protein
MRPAVWEERTEMLASRTRDLKVLAPGVGRPISHSEDWLMIYYISTWELSSSPCNKGRRVITSLSKSWVCSSCVLLATDKMKSGYCGFLARKKVFVIPDLLWTSTWWSDRFVLLRYLFNHLFFNSLPIELSIRVLLAQLSLERVCIYSKSILFAGCSMMYTRYSPNPFRYYPSFRDFNIQNRR